MDVILITFIYYVYKIFVVKLGEINGGANGVGEKEGKLLCTPGIP